MQYVLKFLLCILKWILIVVVVASLGVGAFTFCMDYANISILVTDGMKMRTGVVLGYSNPEELPKFFDENYLADDALLLDTTYHDYVIESFDAQVDVEKLSTVPWESVATVRVTETADINGYLPIALQTPEQLADPNKIPPPPWQGATYDLTLHKQEGQWIIVDVVKDETAEQEG